jgi:hypothetical protein
MASDQSNEGQHQQPWLQDSEAQGTHDVAAADDPVVQVDVAQVVVSDGQRRTSSVSSLRSGNKAVIMDSPARVLKATKAATGQR